MSLFRNPEMKRALGADALFTACAVAGGALFSAAVAGYVLAVCAVGTALFLRVTARRYAALSNLSARLDEMLHDDTRTWAAPNEEGELAVLASEMQKVSVRMREQAERLRREKDRLRETIADIAHQIRTPLTSVRMILPRLGRAECDPDQRRTRVREIGELLARVEWLVTALLQMARLSSGATVLARAPVRVRDVIDAALEPLRIAMEVKELSLCMDVPPDACFTGDARWSAEAVENIVKNCVEHTPSGGCLTVTARANALYTEIVLSDTGPGIPPDALPHVFDRFYRGPDAHPDNAGIGLALSRMIVQMQNGTLRAGNIEPHGARFTIRFERPPERPAIEK